MIIALWLGWLVAQAAAPAPGAPPAVAGPAEPTPAQPTPAAASGPAEPAPPEPGAPATAPASAAPAAEPPAPPSRTAPAPAAPPPQDLSPPPREACVFGGLAYRSGTLPPRVGFSLAGSFNSRYATVPGGLELGWGLDFAFASFSESNGVSSQSQSTFGLLHTAALRAGAFRYWLGVGGGLMVASQDKAPFARAAAGVDIPFDQQTGVQLRIGYASMLTSATVQSGNRTYDRIGNPLDIHAGLFYRFR